MGGLLFSAVLAIGLAASGAALAQSSASANVDSGINASGTTKQQSPRGATKQQMNNNLKATSNTGARAAMGDGLGAAFFAGGPSGM